MSQLAIVPAALAGPQGDLYRNTVDTGSRANLSGSATLGADPSSAWATVAMQSSNPITWTDSGDGLAQIGYFKDTPNANDDCGKNTAGIAFEHKYVGAPYLCDMFFGNFGSNARFATVEVLGTSKWIVYVNGVQYGTTMDLNFITGYPVVRGEYNNNNPISFNFTYGPSGSTAWQYTDNSSTYTTITSANSAITPGSGFVTGSPPSPFTITR